MTIITRIQRLFKADVHGILDSIEEPKAMLNLAIRDMECEVDALTQSNQKIAESLKMIAKQCERLESEKGRVKEHIEISFKANNDDLARQFVRQQLELDIRIKQLKLDMSAAEGRKSEVENQLADYDRQLQEIKSKAETLVVSDQSKEWIGNAYKSHSDHPGVANCDVEIAFLKMKGDWEQGIGTCTKKR